MGTDSLRGALVGAVWAGVMMWLMSLLAVAAWAVSQRFHPLVFAYSLVGVPVLVVIAALPGAVGGYVLAARTGRKGLTPTPPRPILRLLRPALLIMAAGTAVIVAATMTRAVNEHRPIARLASVGGRVDFPGRVVSFPDGRLSDAQLPFVVECLNECNDWFRLSLVRTQVTGAGLGHLRAVCADYCLIVSDDALDESGLRHLSGFEHVQELWVVGTVPPETRDQVQHALP